MSFGAILLLAIGLAMDATAVAAARGCATAKIRPKHVLLVALFFGGFQALMPLLGWFLGAKLDSMLGGWDQWLAFALLAGVGGKMLWEARGEDSDEQLETSDAKLYGTKVMLVLALATSIDAWAVGVTLPILGAPLVPSLVIIGVTTAVHIGPKYGRDRGRNNATVRSRSPPTTRTPAYS